MLYEEAMLKDRLAELERLSAHAQLLSEAGEAQSATGFIGWLRERLVGPGDRLIAQPATIADPRASA